MDEVMNDSVEQDTEAVEVTPAADEKFSELREAYEAGNELTDDQLDLVADVAVSAIREVLKCFGETSSTIDEYDGDEGELILDINGGDLAVLIGRHGRVLDALQLVISSIVSKKLGFHYPVVVDIEGYKNRRKQKIQNIARAAAARAKRQGSARLKPMNAYERRLVHIALVDDEEVSTHSEGEDPARYVVITAVRGE